MTMNKGSHIFDLLLIVTFGIGIALPLVLTDNRKISSIEQRTLAPFPDVALNLETWEAFPSQFEAFFDDHFGLRDQLEQLYSLFSLDLGSSPNLRVTVGGDGYLFYTDPSDGNSLEDYRNNDPLTPEELARWKWFLETRYLSLKEKGIGYMFVIAPEKQTIYGEHFPSRFTRVGKQSRLDQLLEVMKNSPVPILDLRFALLQAKGLGPLYYKTDTHWNDLGASVAQFDVAKYVAQELPDVVPAQYGPGDFTWQTGRGGDLAQMINLQDMLTESKPVLKNALPACKNTSLRDHAKPYYPKDWTPQFMTECQTGSTRNAVILHDSFFTALQPFVSPYFSRATLLWLQRPSFATLEQIERDFPADIVIEETAERYLKGLSPLPTIQDDAYSALQQVLTDDPNARGVLPSSAISPVHPSAARLGVYSAWLEFVGYDQPAAGELTLYWRSLVSRREKLSMTLRVLDNAGREITKVAGDLFGGAYAGDDWPQGVTRVPWKINLPAGVAPGLYQIELTVDSPVAGRVPVLSTELQPISDKLLPGTIKVPIPLPSAEELQRAQPADSRLGNAFFLQGYQLDEVARARESIHVTLYWKSIARTDVDYTIFVHLIDSSGRVRSQIDAQPHAGAYPTSIWDVGELVRDEYTLVLPRDLAPGNYRIELGAYEYPDPTRLAVGDARGNPIGDHLVLEKQVTVQ
jgi:alginate O-acetyltransferase complex protein AlgJ